ncbi:MAG: hypothetical protein ACXWHF_02060 [Chthoniobacterales bacterium]
MNETPVAPAPPPTAGSGCCGMGCATLLALIAFFAIAFVGGAMWAVHHYKHKYTSSESMKMPEDITSEEATPVESATQPPTSAPPTATPAPIKQLETQWKAFEKAADRKQEAQISLSAAEINLLLQNSKNTRDKAYVWIEDNVARVRFSVPLKNVPMMKGRYLNGEATVTASPDGDPGKAEISKIKLSNESVPDSIMDQRFFGMSSARDAISNWLDKQNIRSFRIENDRVISETRGD